MSFVQIILRSVFLACLCLVLLGSNPAKATLLPSEQIGAFSPSGKASHGSLLPGFLAHDNLPTWDSERPSTPGIEFNLLEWSTTDDLPQPLTKVPEVSTWSELRFVAPPLENEQEGYKATYVASQLLAQKMSPRGLIKLSGQLANLGQTSGRTAKRAVSWATRVEYFVYGSLALLALGAIVLTAFRWNESRY